MKKTDLIELFDRMIFYGEIHQRADNAKIANLAGKEMDLTFKKILERGELDFIKSKIEPLENSKIIASLLVLIAPFDKGYAVSKYKYFIDRKDEAFLISQPWGMQNMEDDDFHQKTKEYLLKLR